jgi:hypothetical protein
VPQESRRGGGRLLARGTLLTWRKVEATLLTALPLEGKSDHTAGGSDIVHAT